MPQDILVLETMCVWHKPERAFRLLSCHPQAHADICDNLVPVEIALRCARAVMAGQAFAAYIIIPMWPEGGQLSISRARGGVPRPRPARARLAMGGAAAAGRSGQQHAAAQMSGIRLHNRQHALGEAVVEAAHTQGMRP